MQPQAQQQVITLTLNIGNRQYQIEAPPGIKVLLDRINTPQVHILDSVIRGRKLRFHVESIFTLWTAACLEEIEPELLDWIDGIGKDAVMYDLGASTGPFSLYAAAGGVQVVSFEPEAQNYALLEMNHFLNRASLAHPVIAINAAVSDEYGLGKMYCANYTRGAHEKILDQPKPVLEDKNFVPQHVQSIVKYPLDKIVKDFSLPAPHYLKIDVDGSEAKLIAGAKETLGADSLKSIFIELEAHSEAAIMQTLESFGFRQRMKHQVESYNNLHNYVFER